MKNIGVISASVRTNRMSHRVAFFFKKYIEENKIANVDIIDLKEYQFPIFEERLKYQKPPDTSLIDFAERIKACDGLIIVTPEYNGSFPASLKNITDSLYDEWKRKPIAISTVSNGPFGGSQALISLQFTLWKMKAWTVPALFPVPTVDKSFDENGSPIEPDKIIPRAKTFIDELIWCIEANHKMKTVL